MADMGSKPGPSNYLPGPSCSSPCVLDYRTNCGRMRKDAFCSTTEGRPPPYPPTHQRLGKGSSGPLRPQNLVWESHRHLLLQPAQGLGIYTAT